MKHIVSRGHTRPLTEISFLEEDTNLTLLVSSAHDKCPQIRNGETGDWIGSFHGHKGAVWSLKVDRLTRTLAATGSGDFTAKLWCATTGKELHEFKHRHVVKSVDFAPDSLHLATGCQDGLLRIFDVCQPAVPAIEYKIAETSQEGISKLGWSYKEPNIVFVGKKTGVVEKWDTRLAAASAKPVASIRMDGGESIIDFEQSDQHNVFIVASGKKVCTFSIDGLQPIQAYDMPTPMSFKEEGGVSLCPDGTKFLAVRCFLVFSFFFLVLGTVLLLYFYICSRISIFL
mmetsp:Transcript_21858/g.36573  ORF Transcript_21858/g.36573 Transcript_21858/m.36573 type:complete len:286 (+) Transcript_21858:120-977(+)